MTTRASASSQSAAAARGAWSASRKSRLNQTSARAMAAVAVRWRYLTSGRTVVKPPSTAIT